MLLDAHAHLDMYGDKLESALGEIRQDNIFTISNSVDLPSYERNVEIARACELVLPTFGVHPWKAHEYVGHLEDLDKPTEQSPILGEIGLDYYFVEDASRYPAQREVFEYSLVAASAQDKVINLHTKGAEKDAFRLLIQYEVQKVIVHWYAGPLDILNRMIERGYYFTVGVEVLHSEEIRDIARRIPIAQLLTETDNPGGIKWLAGKSGMPRLLTEVVQAIGAVKNTTSEIISGTALDNFAHLIGDDSRLADAQAIISKRNLAEP